MSDRLQDAYKSADKALAALRKAERAVPVARKHVGETVIEVIEAGASVSDVADYLGLARPTVYEYMRQHRGTV